MLCPSLTDQLSLSQSVQPSLTINNINDSATSHTELKLLMGSHCVSLFLWQMSCSVAMFNWQICQLCINLCKLHRPYLIPEMGPGVAWFHPMAQPVGHGGEMTRNWRQLRVVTPWHTLNKQPWASYCFFFFFLAATSFFTTHIHSCSLLPFLLSRSLIV